MLSNLKPFLKLMAPYKSRLRLAIIAGVIAGLGAGAGFTYGVKELFGLVLTQDRDLETHQIILIAAIFPTLYLIVGVTSFISGYHLNFSGLSVVRDLREKVFAHLQQLPIAFFQRKKSGDVISRITADTQILQYSLSIVARDLILQPITFIGAMGVLIYLGVQTPGVAYIYLSIAIMPVVIFPIRYINRRLGKKAKQQQEELGLVTNNISQNISAAREVRAFNLEAHENLRFSKKLVELFRSQMKVVKYTFSLSPSVEFITSIGLSIAFLVGYLNQVPGEDFTAIFMGLYLSYAPIKRMSFLSGELRKAKSSLERIEELLAEPLEIEDPDEPVECEELKGDITFNDVSFSYDETAALQEVSATIPQGSICALVGPSGAGKSTFASLVPRFYDVSYGGVFIDGHDIRRFRKRDLREQIGIVSQDPVLFDDTVFENIRLGRQEATDEEVYEAAKKAFAHNFITELDDGYGTIVGERGARLSGGQKQRIAIARAFLRDAPILILDEATSALDSESEKEIQAALDELLVGKTALIIAHRFSTIRNATQILVFENSRIIASGTHEELYETCPLYRKLYDQQQGGSGE